MDTTSSNWLLHQPVPADKTRQLTTSYSDAPFVSESSEGAANRYSAEALWKPAREGENVHRRMRFVHIAKRTEIGRNLR